MFPASKATTLESSNKSITNRPHSNSPSTGSGNKEERHIRARRDVEGHASLSSSSVILSVTDTLDTSSAVDMHELTTPSSVNTSSLVHGVITASSNEGNVTQTTTTNYGQANNALVFSNSLNDSSVITVNDTADVTINKNNISDIPVEVVDINKTNTNSVKEEIDYDPTAMQSDSYPSIYAYGVQRLQYFNLLTKLKQDYDNLHSFPNETLVKDLENRNNENSNFGKTGETTLLPKFLINSDTKVKTLHNTDFEEKPTNLFTTNKFIAPNTDADVTTPSATNHENNSESVEVKFNSATDKASTINITSESKLPDVTSSAKHVLINLTISADDAENSYKPLYSLTVTVPTTGSSSETPSVKITPIDIDPTVSTNFNNPSTLEGKTKSTTPEKNNEVWGGICECSCPDCSNSSDDFYDEFFDSTTSKKIVDEENETELNNNTKKSITDIDSTTYENIEATTTTTNYDQTTVNENEDNTVDFETTDFTTDFNSESTTVTSVSQKPCLCPKIQPPPILILEGEVNYNVVKFK